MTIPKAGIELDRRIATEVMGWIKNGDGYDIPNGYRTIEPSSFGQFRPSADIASAWEVVEHCKLFEKYRCLMTDQYSLNAFTNHVYIDNKEIAADTVPMAICLAALKVKDNGT